MTIADIAQYACETTGDTSSEALDFAKRALRLKYQTLYDAHSWRESKRLLDGMPLDPTLNGIFFLPYDAEEVIFLDVSNDGINYTRSRYRERDWIEMQTGPNHSAGGNSPWFYRAENLAWPYLNPGKLTLTTSSVSPFSAYVEGTDQNGYPVNETFALSATQSGGTIIPASIQTANSYSLVTVLSKSDIQTLSVFAERPASLNIVLAQQTNELVYTQIVLYPPPAFVQNDGVTPINVFVRTQVKIKADTLPNDLSVPRISHVWDALIEFTLSSLYTRTRQLAKADAREAKGMQHIQAAVNVEKNQSEFSQQCVPTIYQQADYLDDAWGPTSSYPFF